MFVVEVNVNIVASIDVGHGVDDVISWKLEIVFVSRHSHPRPETEQSSRGVAECLPVVT